MLSYAFQSLQEQGYKNLETESFADARELLAEILLRGVSKLIKQGLGKDYIDRTEELSTIRGKIEITESLKRQSATKNRVVCNFDEFSEDTSANRIIKATLQLLVKSSISKERKKCIKKQLVFFDGVSTTPLQSLNWKLTGMRKNRTYMFLINICNMIVAGELQTQKSGSNKVMDYLDEQRMCHLYEKFILGYYQKEYKGILVAKASQIEWQLDDGIGIMLPVMQSDIMLSRGNDVLIIDAKYYSHMLQKQFDKYSIHSGNLYQIFTYVKNKDVSFGKIEHRVAGMLLYARTDEEVAPNNLYQMSGNQITVKSLDLNCDFGEIKNQLDEVVGSYFGLTET